MVRRLSATPWPLVLLAAACTRPIALPGAPAGGERPHIASFAPTAAFTEDRVTLVGTGLRDVLSVRFGGRAAPAPEQASADGTRLVVRVPDDADDGGISIVTEHGETSSEQPFRWKGRGHLRRGRVAAQADLRPVVRRALWLASGEVVAALVSEPVREVRLDGEARLPVRQPGALAANADGSALAVLELDGGSDCPESAALALFRGPGFETAEPVRTCLEGLDFDWRHPDYAWEGDLALDGQGRRALVVEGWTASAVDFGDTPPAVRAVDNETLDGWAGAAWIGGTRFLVGEGRFVRPVDAAAQDPLGYPVPVFDSEAHAILSVASAGPRAVVGTRFGALGVLDVSGDTPVVAAVADTLTWGPCPSVSLSADGAAAAAVQGDAADRVVVFELDPAPPRLLAMPRLELPAAVATGPAGTWLVATPGGWDLLSPRGEWLDRTSLTGALACPRLRTAPADDGAPGVPVLQLVQSTFERVLRLDAATLAVDGSTDLSFAGGHGPVRWLAGLPGGERLYVLHHDGLARTAPGDFDAEAPDVLPLPAQSGSRQIDLSPDGRAILVQEWPAAALPSLRLVPTDGPLAAARPVALPLEGAFAAVMHPDGWLASASAEKLALHDLGSVLSGSARPLRDPVALPASLRALWPAPGAVGLLAMNGRVRLVRPDGSVVEAGRVPADVREWSALGTAWRGVTWDISPDGRALYCLKRDHEARTASLVHVVLDPDSGTVGDEGVAIELPPGAAEFRLYPDGGRAVVLDTEQDRLLLLE